MHWRSLSLGTLRTIGGPKSSSHAGMLYGLKSKKRSKAGPFNPIDQVRRYLERGIFGRH